MLVEGTSNWTCNVSEQTRLAMTATPDSLDAALLEEAAFVITPMSAETAERNFGMDSVAPNERYRLVRSISNGDDDDVEAEDVDDVGNADIIEVDPVRAAQRFTANLLPWEGSNHETLVVAR